MRKMDQKAMRRVNGGLVVSGREHEFNAKRCYYHYFDYLEATDFLFDLEWMKGNFTGNFVDKLYMDVPYLSFRLSYTHRGREIVNWAIDSSILLRGIMTPAIEPR